MAIGAKCSVIGVGTDIGGSIRIPAAFNGCYGLRPTALRIPNLGNFGITSGQESIRGVVGPLGQSVDDLDLFMSAMLAAEPWDTETMLVPVPWRQPSLKKDFTIGVMLDDGYVSCFDTKSAFPRVEILTRRRDQLCETPSASSSSPSVCGRTVDKSGY